jgi:hypothetical protein
MFGKRSTGFAAVDLVNGCIAIAIRVTVYWKFRKAFWTDTPVITRSCYKLSVKQMLEVLYSDVR